MIVDISGSAEAGLGRIGAWLLEQLGRDALWAVERLRQACLSLNEMPLRFPLVPMHEESGLRRRVAGNYSIFYVVEKEAVTVLRILHGAQDFEQILFPLD